MFHCSQLLVVAGLFTLLSTTAKAEETIIIEEKSKDSDRAGANESIEIDETISANAELGDVLSQVSGVYIRRYGGLGEYSSISIRGSTSRQVEIFLNEIPLNPDGSSSVNLSELPLLAFDTIQLWRSNPPPHFMTSAIGGAVNLQSKKSAPTMVGYSLGSYGWNRAKASVSLDKLESSLFLDAVHSNGNYTYFSNNATPFNNEDDGIFERRNNQRDQLSFLGFGGQDHLRWLHSSLLKKEGLPGTEVIQSESRSLQSTRHLSALQWRRESSHVHGWQQFRSDIYADPLGELGQGEQRVVLSLFSHGFRGNHRWMQNETVVPSLGISVHNEGLRQSNIQEKGSWRHRQILKGNLHTDLFFGTDWELSAQSQALVVHSAFETQSQFDFSFLPKASIRYQPRDVLVLWGTVARNIRPPTVEELYGQTGIMSGNPMLLPEESVLMDVGLSTSSNVFDSKLQFSYFHSWNRDHIILVQNAQRVSIPINFGSTEVQGLEFRSEAQLLPFLNWSWTGTWNHSVNLSGIESQQGKQLPNIPTWLSHNDLSIKIANYQLGHSWFYVAGNYWDATNWYQSPQRSIHNAFMLYNFKKTGWSLEFEGRNLADRISQEMLIDPLQPELGSALQSMTDYVGFPLAGRSLLLSLQWKSKDI